MEYVIFTGPGYDNGCASIVSWYRFRLQGRSLTGGLAHKHDKDKPGTFFSSSLAYILSFVGEGIARCLPLSLVQVSDLE
jgi:hypothetical protein